MNGLSALEVQAIVRHLQDKAEACDREANQRSQDFRERYSTSEEAHCPMAVAERERMARKRGKAEVYKEVLRIIENRKI